MPERHIILRHPVVTVPEMVFRESAPGRMSEALHWVQEHPRDFSGLLWTFDSVISRFNNISSGDPDLRNTLLIKQRLAGRELPAIRTLLSETGNLSIDQYTDMWLSIKDKMRVEEFRYQNTKETDPKNLVVASVFVAYEELVKERSDFQRLDLGQDYLTEALMETAAGFEQGSNQYLLFNALASSIPNGMNWVNEEDRFSPEFRNAHGYQ